MVDKEFYKTSEYMTFFVLSPGEIKIIRWFGSPVRDIARITAHDKGTLYPLSCNCPCEMISAQRSTPTYSNVWPWALFILIAKEALTGNWSCLKENGNSEGIMGILGINAISPFAGPVRTTSSITLFHKDFICYLVPLHKFGG